MGMSERAERAFEASYVANPTTGCYEWMGTRSGNGYGQFGKRNLGAHRWSYARYVGPIPESMFVLHRCDVRQCVRPEHLFLGTHQDNMDDKVAKGRQSRTGAHSPARGLANGRHASAASWSPERHGWKTHPESRPRGERNGNARLTASDVVEIRRRRAAGERLVDIGESFGISFATVWGVAARRSWKHVA